MVIKEKMVEEVNKVLKVIKETKEMMEKMVEEVKKVLQVKKEIKDL